MKILGKFNFRVVLFSGIIEVLITVLLCYTLAVSLHHKQAWLPTVSECGEEAPEKYFFRWGILVGGLLLMIEALVLHTAERSSNAVYYLGLIAGACLTGVAAVASNEDLPLHLVFALSFFGLEDVMVLLFICENFHKMSLRSKVLRVSSALLACAATATRFLFVFGAIHYSEKIPIIAIVEWINVFALIFFHITLSDDLDDLYIAELEEDSEKEHSSAPKDGSKSDLLTIKSPL